MTRVLITGFEPFKDAPTNPSWDAVELLSRTWDGPAELIARQLPVVFGEAPKRLAAHIAKHLPDVVIAVGVAEGTSAITLERIAINLDAASIPDNAGYAPRDVEAVPGGPLALPTTLPVREIEAALTEYGIPVRLSTSAGSYVCNHTFYSLQHQVEAFKVPSGFIHVPATDAMGLGESVPTMDVDTIARALGIAIEVTVHQLTGGRDVQRRPARLAPPAMAGHYSPARLEAEQHQPILADDDEPTQGYIPAFVDVAPEDDEQPTQAFLPAFATVAAGEEAAEAPGPAPIVPAWAPKPAAAPEAIDATEASAASSPETPAKGLTWDEIISGNRSS